MTDRTDFSDDFEEPEQAELDRLLFEGLGPLDLPSGRDADLRGRLLARVAESATENAGFLTVRAKDGRWAPLRKGIRVKPLWQGPEGHSVLLDFAPGASLPVHRHRFLEEGIVLRGGLQMDELDLGPGDYHLSPPGSRHGRIGSRQGALAYLRGTSLGHAAGVLRELLGGFLPFGGGRSRTVYAGDGGGWQELAPGVSVKEVCSDGTRTSRFCRLEPGAALDGHAHSLDEECMMLEGDLFLGDLLLRAGDYQLAPAGTRHGRITTDVGALLFVRGPAV